MLETKRNERLEKRCIALQEENKELIKRNKELEKELVSLNNLIDAASNYTEEHRKAMRILAESRERYELAYKQMLKLKKEYEERMERVLKGFE